MKLEDLKNELIERLIEDIDIIREEKYPEDYIYQVIDNILPIYDRTTLEIADNDIWLATKTPDESLNSSTAIECIRNNIFEELNNVAHDWLDNNIGGK